MSQESLTIIMSLMGAFASLGLIVNAFFIKQLVSSLSRVELGLAVLVEKHKGTADRIKLSEVAIEKLLKDIDSFKKQFHDIRNLINQLQLRFDLHESQNENQKD